MLSKGFTFWHGTIDRGQILLKCKLKPSSISIRYLKVVIKRTQTNLKWSRKGYFKVKRNTKTVVLRLKEPWFYNLLALGSYLRIL